MPQLPDLQRVTDTYFSDPNKRRILEVGETLMRSGEHNDTLYLIVDGTLSATATHPDGTHYELFKARKNMFVGVYSVFSQTYISLTTIVAEERCELAYVNFEELKQNTETGILLEIFLPVLITRIVHRHKISQELVLERERTLKHLLHHEKLASLGQMAAGIAHELNNSIAILLRNSEWLNDAITQLLSQDSAELLVAYQRGVDDGRPLSSREIRRESKQLKQTFGLSMAVARQAAELGFTAQMKLPAETVIGAQHHHWEMGAAIHDMRVAAQQATHVVRSVKTLGAPQSKYKQPTNVNESISDALVLLRSPLRGIAIQTKYQPMPEIIANRGELMQIWANLIKNAAESLHHDLPAEPEISVETEVSNTHIVVVIRDNGAGIPPEIQDQIFQPNVTTKVGGLSFGLGLGLTIVQRLVDGYEGTIAVSSIPGDTRFTVQLPLRTIESTTESTHE